MTSKYPTREQILAELTYNPDDGSFTRKSSDKPSATFKNGYIYDYVCKRQVPRSVLVWIVETGSEPGHRIRFKGRSTDTRFSQLELSKPQFGKQRRWTAEDDECYLRNVEHFRAAFDGRFEKEREFAWAVVLLS